MRIKLLNNNEVILKTKDKLCKEDIKVVVDDTNLEPENIKKNISILGVTGVYDNSNGGGAFSVLSGVVEPTSDIGEDGDVYFVLEE